MIGFAARTGDRKSSEFLAVIPDRGSKHLRLDEKKFYWT